jgi:CheY-like chemotaxis protein
MQSRPHSALVVEDRPFFGLVAGDMLGESGFQVFHAFVASDALSILQSHPDIEVLVTEADLPGVMDGVELSQRVAERWPHVRLVITAAARDFSNSDLPRGARVLRKPYATADLQNMASEMVLEPEL